MSNKREKKFRQLYRQGLTEQARADVQGFVKKYKRMQEKETAKTIAICMLSVAVLFLIYIAIAH